MRLAALLLLLPLACSDMPPEIPRTACRGLAVDKANTAADAKCSEYAWEECPSARSIENELMQDLEKCDGER